MSKSYWTPREEYTACYALGRLANGPSLVHKLKNNPQPCHNLQDFLQKVDQAGQTLDEFEMLQTVLRAYSSQIQPALELITSWLVYDILPRLQESHVRSQALETTVDLLSSRFLAFVEDIADALPEVSGIQPAGPISEARLNRLSVALQRYKETCSSNDNNYASQSTKELRRASENTNEDGCYTIMQDAAQEPPSGFEALSNASNSSTCTLVGENSNMSRDRVTPATTLELRVSVHFDDIVTFDPDDGLEYYETPYPLVVRMHRNAPFKTLIDKLREKFGDLELRQKNSPLECMFDSDTPASLNLETDDELIYALINDRVKAWDLAM